MSVSHPDGRPYPWLNSTTAANIGGDNAAPLKRYLIYQPFAGMCNQFSCLESAVAIARATGRTLVLPRWRPQYGWPWLGEMSEYFDTAPLSQLVRCVTLDEFAAERVGASPGEGVTLLRLALAYNPTWSDRGFELYPDLRSLLVELEYFREVDQAGQLALGCGGGSGGSVCAEAQCSVTLERALRGEREIAALFADFTQPVLALDHAFNTVALPSVLDAGARATLLSALKPNVRLRAKLNVFMGARVARPCLAAHVRRTDHWRLAELMQDKRFWPTIGGFARQIDEQVRRRSLASWLLATDCREASELATLRAVEWRVDYAELLEGEDGVAAAVLDMWACIGVSRRGALALASPRWILRHLSHGGRSEAAPPARLAALAPAPSLSQADFFIGTRGSMYTDYIERFRVAGGKVVDHLFFELSTVPEGAALTEGAPAAAPVVAAPIEAASSTRAPPPPPTAPPPPQTAPPPPPAATASALAEAPTTAPVAPSLVEVLAQREQRSRAAEHERAATLAAAAAGGAARGGALLGLMAQRLPPELRGKILAFHPQAAEMPKTICRAPKELFDDFIIVETPRLRRRPMRVAPRGTTANVALLIEPRAHYALEHVVRNAMLFLNGAGRAAAADNATDGGSAPEWQLQIFHGTANLEHIRAAFTPSELEHVELVSLEVDNLSTLAHNELMCAPSPRSPSR